jgi:hypothetical protein
MAIAYIDDNPMETWLAARVLELSKLSKKIITAINGKKGWDMLEEYFKDKRRLSEVLY